MTCTLNRLLMQVNEIVSTWAGVWGPAWPHHYRRGKDNGLTKSLLRAVQASLGLYAEQELRSTCLAKHSNLIAKYIIKVSSYSEKSNLRRTHLY